jgi:hypothetical protein
MGSYLNLPYRTVYSRTEIRDENGEIQSVYYLHSQNVKRDQHGSYIASLCSKCCQQISASKLPEFSIAAGMDFGNPSHLGLQPLSATEKK